MISYRQRGGILLARFSRHLKGESIIGALHDIAITLDGRLGYTPVTISYTRSPREERRYNGVSIELGGDRVMIHDPSDSAQIFSEGDYGVLILHPDCESSRLIAGMLEKAVVEFESRSPTPRGTHDRTISKVAEYTVHPRELKGKLTILVVIQGEYGRRILDWLRRGSPPTWTIESIQLTGDIPEVVDDPGSLLPSEIPKADLVLFLSETDRSPQLASDIVRESGAMALIAPVDRTEWMPPGQITQIKRTMLRWGVETSFPRPFCSLEPSGSEAIDMFAGVFGKPEIEIKTEDGVTVSEMSVIRGAPCGCTAFVAENIAGERLDQAVERAGLLHHHYPCLASMDREPDLDDTLMHLSGLILKRNVDDEVSKFLKKERSFIDPRQFRR